MMGKLGLAFALIGVPAIAHAQPKPPTPTQIQQAGDLVKKAIAKSQAGDHAVAIELYMDAYQIVPTPILLSNIGSEYEQSGKAVEALKYFCKYLDADPTGSNASYATAKARALQIDLGNPPASDDNVCKPKPPPAPAPKPPEPPPVDNTAFQPTGGPTTETADDHPGRPLEVTGAAVATVGAVGLAIGIVYALKAKSLNDQIDDHVMNTEWPAFIDGVPIAQWNTQGDAWNRDTYIFAIGGGVALAAGIGLFLYGHGQSAPTATDHVSVVPTITSGGGGIVATGRF